MLTWFSKSLGRQSCQFVRKDGVCSQEVHSLCNQCRTILHDMFQTVVISIHHFTILTLSQDKRAKWPCVKWYVSPYEFILRIPRSCSLPLNEHIRDTEMSKSFHYSLAISFPSISACPETHNIEVTLFSAILGDPLNNRIKILWQIRTNVILRWSLVQVDTLAMAIRKV